MKDGFTRAAAYVNGQPVRVGYRDDSERLRELIAQCVGLNTMDTLLLSRKAPKVWDCARSIAREIGVDFKNPPIPGVCKKAVGDCGCGGQC